MVQQELLSHLSRGKSGGVEKAAVDTALQPFPVGNPRLGLKIEFRPLFADPHHEVVNTRDLQHAGNNFVPSLEGAHGAAQGHRARTSTGVPGTDEGE